VSEHEPHYGRTRHGLPVHLHTIDHLPAGEGAGKLNRWLAVRITNGVGTMWCAYVFALIALAGLPQAIQQSVAGGHFSPLPLVQWVAQTFLQLVLLSVIIVGQNIAAAASDARAAKTFDDVEQLRADQATALDRLDEKTEGGIKAILDAVNALGARPAQEQAVHVQTVSLSDTQVGQITAQVQAALLKQAKRTGGTSPKGM
jgi:hypothetical protein